LDSRSSRLVATGVSVALQQRFSWGFILLCGWVCIAPFCVIGFDNMKGLAGVHFVCA
jgi:hypothetical protein